MEAKYRKIIKCMLDINPKPTDEQFHALAEAINVDYQELESLAYTMLAEHERENAVEVLAAPEALDLSHSERTLSGRGDEDFMPYYDAALNDGSTDTTSIEILQDAMHADGGFTPFNQDPLKDDGPKVPTLRKLVSRLVTANTGLKTIQNGLRRVDLPFEYEDGDNKHLHMEIEHPEDVQDVVDELQKQGFKLRIDKGVLAKNSFAVKAPNGLTLQRTGTHLRIFYS